MLGLGMGVRMPGGVCSVSAWYSMNNFIWQTKNSNCMVRRYRYGDS